MLNAQQNVQTNSSFRSNIANSQYEEVLPEYNATQYEGLVAEYHQTEYEELVEEYHPTEYEVVVAEYHSTEYDGLVAEYHQTEYEELVAEYHPTEYEEVVAEYHSTEYEEVVAEYHSTENEEVVAEYHPTEYEEAHSEQRVDTFNAVHIALPCLPPRPQRIHISLRLLCLVIVCSLIAVVLTGVVTFLVTREILPKTKCQDANEINCYWSSWSSWYQCSVTCGNGVQIRIKRQMSNTKLCRKNETFDSKTCSRGKCTGYDDQLEMKFSRKALHKDVFISADRTIISNIQTIFTSKSADSQLNNFDGTISDICVGNNELIYYEVNYTYTIIKALTSTSLVLEVGLAERSKVDRYYYVGNNNVSGWSFHLAKNADNNSVYLYADDPFHRKSLGPFNNNTVGKKVHGKFKLFINRQRNEFSLRQDDSIFYVFKNVTSVGKLCPVFGVHNPYWVHAKLQIMNPRNFTYY